MLYFQRVLKGREDKKKKERKEREDGEGEEVSSMRSRTRGLTEGIGLAGRLHCTNPGARVISREECRRYL